jgi:ribonuclease HI
MSVKGFLEKYFKVSGSEPVAPMPHVATAPVQNSTGRTFRPSEFDRYRSTKVSMFGESEEHGKSTPFVQPTREVESPRTFHIFTDGACSDNGRKGAKGGFAVHVYSKKGLGLDISQPLLKTEPQTNNRGELRAIQAALDLIESHESEWSKEYDDYCIWSDSEYSIHCLTKWATGWRRNGWKKSDGGLIQNIDLIKPVYEKLARMSRVRLRHVRAHQRGRENEFPYDGNTEADRLARSSLQRISLLSN